MHHHDQRNFLRPELSQTAEGSSISIPSVNTAESHLSTSPLLKSRVTSFDLSYDASTPTAVQWNQYLRRTSVDCIEMGEVSIDVDPVDAPAPEARADEPELPVNSEPDVFTACSKPPEGYPKLDWKPVILSNSILVLATTFTAICLASVISLGAIQYFGQTSFHTVHPQSYFAIRYLPTLIAGINRLWMQSILINLAWMTPYIAMNRNGGKKLPESNRSLFAPYYAGVGLPSISIIIRDREWLLVYTWIQYILAVQLGQAAKANFLSAIPDETGWTVKVTISSAEILTVMYTLQLVGMLVLSIRSSRMSFGLADNVASVADQINIVAHSNILGGFKGLDWNAKLGMPDCLHYCKFRIGYWSTTTSGRTWYGIGTEDKIKPSTVSTNRGASPTGDRRARHSVVSIFHPIGVIILTACSTLLTTLLGYHIYLWHWKRGVHVYNKRASSTEIINIYFRFLPAFFAAQSSIYWAIVDKWFRRAQIFASMRSPCPADKSLFLEYPYDLPVLVTLKALRNKHWKVAWFSAVSLSASFLPTLAGGIFTATLSTKVKGTYDITIAPESLIATFVLLSIHTLTIPLTWHGGKRRIPRPWLSIGDVIAMCYRSYMLQADAFDYPEPDDRRIHMQSRIHLAKEEYAFGKFVGTDGEEHIGFDIANVRQEDGRAVRHVVPLAPEEQRLAGWFGPRRRRQYSTVDGLDAEHGHDVESA